MLSKRPNQAFTISIPILHMARGSYTEEFVLRELGLAKVHFWVRVHELLEHVLFVLLLRGGQAHRLLALVVHHLLHSLARVPVKVAELAILRLHLLRVDLRVAFDHTLPPLHLIVLLQTHHHLAVLKGPETIVYNHAVIQLSVDDALLLALDPDLQGGVGDANVKHLGLGSLRHWHVNGQIAQLLDPHVGIGFTSVANS
jgi:hypothetical protein